MYQWERGPLERSRANDPRRLLWGGRSQAIDSKRKCANTTVQAKVNEAKDAKWQVSFTWVQNKEGAECSCKR